VLRRIAISYLTIAGLVAVVAPAQARTRPRYGDTLRVEIAGDPWQRPGGLARRLVLDGLTEEGPDGTIRPALAISWTADNNEHRWQFRLRAGVHFHDGSPVTSTAVAASLMSACAANCPWGNIHALSSSIVFTSDEPMPQLPALLAGDEFPIAKAHATPDGGSGPFQVSGFVNGVLTLSANDSSWQGRPFLDAIEIRVHRPVSDQWMDFAAGRADLVEVPAERIRQAQQQHLPLTISPPVEVLALELEESGALSNPSLRSAIGYAIDRGALANVIFQRQGVPAAALLPQNVSGFAFLFSAERDLNKAHEVRGGAAPPALQLEADGEGALQLAAQRIVLNLREAGFNVQTARAGAASPAMRLRLLRIESADAAADLASMARAAAVDLPAFSSDAAAVYRAERELLDRKTLIPLLDLPLAYAVGTRVRDLQLHSDGMPDLAAVSLEPSR
jgi:peptide/nickel transport system substrate-binding protein